VLEGSVQKANDRVRVTAQLIRAEDGFHVWSQNYTRPLNDIFAIQDEIATDVADALGSSLLGAAKPNLRGVSTNDLSAYDSYLKGLEQQAIYSYGSLDSAEGYFKQALARDPGFIDARLALVRNYVLKYTTGLINDDEALALAEPLVAEVRARQPDNQLARALELTLQLMIFKPSASPGEIQANLEELQGLMQVLPTESLIRTFVAQTLTGYFNKSQQAIEVLQSGLMIDPLEAELHRVLGKIYMQDKRLDEARASLQRSLELAPDNPNNYGTMADLERAADNLPAALDWNRQASLVDRQDHEIATFIAEDLYSLSLPEEGDYWLARVQALVPGSSAERGLEMQRALARNDTQQAMELSAALIADQVEDRQGVFQTAVFTYVDIMLKEDRAREAYDFLVSVRPETTRYDEPPTDLQGLIMQWASIALMSGFESFETREAAWKRFTDQLNAQGFPWKKGPDDDGYTWDFIMNGEVEQAIDHYLEYELNEPLAAHLDRHRKRLYAVFAPVYEDPRVAAGLREDAERFAVLRQEVSEMLQRPEWNNP